MTIQINNTDDISKLMAFIRVCSKGKFSVPQELVEEILKQLYRYAQEKNISVDVVTPSGEKIATFTVFGAVAGAAVGYLMAAAPGALAGAVIGAGIGLCVAHLRIQIETPTNGSPATICIL
jgi:hypothetical protein